MIDERPNALETHRRQQRTKGLVRVPATDAALLREVAAELRSGTRRAAAVRSLLRAPPPQGPEAGEGVVEVFNPFRR